MNKIEMRKVEITMGKPRPDLRIVVHFLGNEIGMVEVWKPIPSTDQWTKSATLDAQDLCRIWAALPSSGNYADFTACPDHGRYTPERPRYACPACVAEEGPPQIVERSEETP